MTGTTRTRIVVTLASAALALAAPAAAGAQQSTPGTGSGTATTPEFIPFVTDFGLDPRPAGEPIVINPKAAEAAAPRSWADLTLGTGVGIAFALLVVGAAVAFRRLRTAGTPGLGAEAR